MTPEYFTPQLFLKAILPPVKHIMMGRSIHFNFENDVEIRGKLNIAPLLEQLREGQHIRITVKEPEEMRLYRCVSTYELEPSSMEAVLAVDAVNCEPRFNKHGIRCIALRDMYIPVDRHIYAWFLTTDGYIRESEGYGIMYEVTHVEFL